MKFTSMNLELLSDERLGAGVVVIFFGVFLVLLSFPAFTSLGQWIACRWGYAGEADFWGYCLFFCFWVVVFSFVIFFPRGNALPEFLLRPLLFLLRPLFWLIDVVAWLTT